MHTKNSVFVSGKFESGPPLNLCRIRLAVGAAHPPLRITHSVFGTSLP